MEIVGQFWIRNFLKQVKDNDPRMHTIIEAHPDVIRRMKEKGWDKKENVRIVEGRWQDVIHKVGPFDGIFYDTYAEDDSDLKEFHSHLPRLLKENGVYSFYNGEKYSTKNTQLS